MALVLYTAPTPDGYKVSITLEELGLPYQVKALDLAGGEQKSPAFLAINPNGKVPVLVDDGFAIMESGAILLWLAEKAAAAGPCSLLPADPQGRSLVLQWLMFQVGGVGPMMGQANVFHRYFPEKVPAAIARYQSEVKRLFAAMDARLAGSDYLAGAYSIADIANWCWVRTHDWSGVDITPFPHLIRWKKAIAARPAVGRGVLVPETSPVKEAADNSDFIERTRKLLGFGRREA